MSPKLLSTLWKERWGKAALAEMQIPYTQGMVSDWVTRFSQNLNNSLLLRLLMAVLLVYCMLTVLLASQLTKQDQLTVSTLLVLIAFYLRLHAGIFITLFLVGLSFIVSSRYLVWRFTETLGHGFDVAFVYGFILCVAETYLCLQVVLGLVETRWPLKRAHSMLRKDQNQWPTVDVLLLCVGRPTLEVESSTAAIRALDWPQKKANFFLLDDHERPEIKKIADSVGLKYLVPASHSTKKLDLINHALEEARSELIVVLECDEITNKDILQMTSGWFMRDARLGLLTTPHHYLVPEPSNRNLKLFDACDLEQSFAMIRRSMLVRLVESELIRLPSDPVQFVMQTKALGYDCAYIGFSRDELAPGDDSSAMAIGDYSATELPIFRVNQPFSNDTPLLGLRIGLSSLEGALRFYEMLPRWVLLLAPLAFLLGGITVIQAPVEVFAIYALPHFFLWYIAKGRLYDKRRLKVWDEIRQIWLGCDLMVRTALALVQTEISRIKNNVHNKDEVKKPAFDWLFSFPFSLVLFLNLIGLVAGVVNFPWSGEYEWSTRLFYIFWVSCNLLLLCAMAAVAEETRHIQHYWHLQVSRPAMLKFPQGRTLRCVTENFPEEALLLKLPAPMTLEGGALLQLSIFRGNREFSFPVEVSFSEGVRLRVRILEEAQEDYLALSQATRSRGPDWPQWLPGSDADQLLPPWISRPLNAVRIAVLDFYVGFGKSFQWNNWAVLWNKKK